LYVFLETPQIERQRRFLETEVGLPVVETDTNPHNKHGVVKHDAGNLLISLNLSPQRRFSPDASDGLLSVFDSGGERTTDPFGHHYLLNASAHAARLRALEFVLRVDDLRASIAFYRDLLGLEPQYLGPDRATFATGTVPISIDAGSYAVDGRCIRRTSYLLVLHTPDIDRTRTSLASDGLAFLSHKISSTPPGKTVRFKDPSGHQFCLYEPSQEALSWPSGPKIRQLIGDQA
jgi:catechol 2,3-dioxygenase-like lactoylglutathione lyase family enzyme